MYIYLFGFGNYISSARGLFITQHLDLSLWGVLTQTFDSVVQGTNEGDRVLIESDMVIKDSIKYSHFADRKYKLKKTYKSFSFSYENINQNEF